MANTPLRSVRVSDDVWKAAQAKALANGLSVSEVIVAFLKGYGS